METSQIHFSETYRKGIETTITENFAKPGVSGFMSVLAELMDSYGVVNLAKETGIDRVTLWRFMRGDRLPRLDNLQKILDALGIKVQFSFDDRMKEFLEYSYWKKQWDKQNKAKESVKP